MKAPFGLLTPPSSRQSPVGGGSGGRGSGAAGQPRPCKQVTRATAAAAAAAAAAGAADPAIGGGAGVCPDAQELINMVLDAVMDTAIEELGVRESINPQQREALMATLRQLAIHSNRSRSPQADEAMAALHLLRDGLILSADAITLVIGIIGGPHRSIGSE